MELQLPSYKNTLLSPGLERAGEKEDGTANDLGGGTQKLKRAIIANQLNWCSSYSLCLVFFKSLQLSRLYIFTSLISHKVPGRYIKYVSFINRLGISLVTDGMIKARYFPPLSTLKMVGKFNGPLPDLKTSGFYLLLILPICHTTFQPFVLMAFHIRIYFHYYF